MNKVTLGPTVKGIVALSNLVKDLAQIPGAFIQINRDGYGNWEKWVPEAHGWFPSAEYRMVTPAPYREYHVIVDVESGRTVSGTYAYDRPTPISPTIGGFRVLVFVDPESGEPPATEGN